MKFLLVFLSFFSLAFANDFSKNILESLYLDAISEGGNMEKVLKAEKEFLNLEEQEPRFYNRVRLASITALKAKFVSVFKKSGFANSSIQAFEKLELEFPARTDIDDIYEFHLFRGQTFFKFPSMFGKKEVAESDIKKAIEILESNNLERHDGEKARLFLSYAIILKDEKNQKYKEYAQKALDLNALESENTKIANGMIKS